jgi:hypothetical protein
MTQQVSFGEGLSALCPPVGFDPTALRSAELPELPVMREDG